MGGSAPRRDHHLPVETTSFVDRRGELTEGRELLARARLVTLTGPGGVGKTRLAARIAARVQRAFPDGVRFVHLSGLRDPALVPLAAADALGLHGHSAQPPLDALVEQVRDRRLLLVVDNCEHLLGATAELAAALLRGTTGVRVLATSRHRLGLTEEHLLEVRPLPVPDPDGDLSAAEGYPALTLFADRAAAVVPGFRLTPDNRAAVARLCRRLDGLPLAIELAAVRMRVLGVEQLLDRLDDRYRLLTAGSPAALPRHQTLRAAVDWSYDLCTEREQLVWARLSVLAGSFDLDTAEAVCADADEEQPQGGDSRAGGAGPVRWGSGVWSGGSDGAWLVGRGNADGAWLARNTAGRTWPGTGQTPDTPPRTALPPDPAPKALGPPPDLTHGDRTPPGRTLTLGPPPHAPLADRTAPTDCASPHDALADRNVPGSVPPDCALPRGALTDRTAPGSVSPDRAPQRGALADRTALGSASANCVLPHGALADRAVSGSESADRVLPYGALADRTAAGSGSADCVLPRGGLADQPAPGSLPVGRPLRRGAPEDRAVPGSALADCALPHGSLADRSASADRVLPCGGLADEPAPGSVPVGRPLRRGAPADRSAPESGAADPVLPHGAPGDPTAPVGRPLRRGAPEDRAVPGSASADRGRRHGGLADLTAPGTVSVDPVVPPGPGQPPPSVGAGDAGSVVRRIRMRADDVLEAVAGLVDKSVLSREPGPGGVRYRLLDTLRQYGLDRLRRLPGEEAAARRRQRAWMLRRAEACERAWFGPGQPETVALLRADQDSLRAALDFSLTTPGEALAGLRLAGTLWFYWHACGAPREGLYWLDRALDANPEPTRERARGLWVSGLLAAATLDLTRGRRRAEDAHALARALGDAAEQAHAEYVIGVIRLFDDDLPGALAHFQASVARGRVPGQHLSLAGLDQVELACALGFLGEADRAVAVCEEALRLCERHGEQWVRSYVLRMLALAYTVQRDWPQAERHAREALRLKRAVHDVIGIALTLDLLAAIAAEQGAAGRAAVLLGGADRVWADIDTGRWGARILNSARRDSEERAARALGRDGFERAHRRGGGLGLTEIVGYALQEPARHRAGPPAATAQPSYGDTGVRLTRRETEVARLVAEGLANQQIADRLVIARRTAEGHVERILSKLGFSNRSQIAAWVSAQR